MILSDFIKTYVENAHADGIVIGLSGGIDSAVTAVLCKNALGKEKVLCIFMPEESTPKLDSHHQELLISKFDLFHTEIDISPIIELVTIHGEFIDTEGIAVSECDDPDDNKFIECAIASNAKLIVSGDKHLLKISGFQGIAVCKPRDFIDLYLK